MNKSKILYSLFFIFLFEIIIIISLYENNSAYSQRVFQTYESEIYGIKIQYPANWVSYGDDSITETNDFVVGFHPIEKDVPFVYLWVEFLSPENATLESFTNQSLKHIQGPVGGTQVIKILNQNSSVTLGGQPAHKVVYEETISNAGGESRTLKHMSIWNVLETEGYRLTFSANDKEQYEQYIKTAKKIINSFEFTR
jgi:hypothetical protein